MKTGRTFFLEACLLLITFTAPLFFGSVHPWASMLWAALLFLLVFCVPETFLNLRSLPRLFLVGIFLLTLLLVVQLVLHSFNSFATAGEGVRWLAYGSAFLLMGQVDRSHLRYGILFLISVGVCEAFYGLYQLDVGGEGVLWRDKVFHLGFLTGTYLNRNHMAGFFELCLGLHLGMCLMAFRKRHVVRILLGGLVFLLLLIAFLKTGSRSGILSFLVSVLFFSFFLVGKKRSDSVFVLLFIIAGFLLAFGMGGNSFLLRFSDFADEQRLSVWQNALEILRDYPWWGTGLGTFEWVFPGYQLAEFTWGWSHAHNDYLELLIELGAVGFGILILSFLWLWGVCLRRLLSLRPEWFPMVWGGG